MKILVFCDDLYHPAATVRTGLAPLAPGREFAFDWVENAAGWPLAALAGYSVALLAKSNVLALADKTPWLTGEGERLFLDYVRRGGGLVIVHSGTASYAQVAPMRAVTGGTFLHHPPQCTVTAEPQVGHALTAGVAEPFAIHDEHYFMALDDPQADVFLHTRSQHGVQPAGWTRREGKGRVAVLTPGHNPEVWLHPSFQKLLVNALHWVTPAS
jgi:type 1 glutamine amidotransferase